MRYECDQSDRRPPRRDDSNRVAPCLNSERPVQRTKYHIAAKKELCAGCGQKSNRNRNRLENSEKQQGMQQRQIYACNQHAHGRICGKNPGLLRCKHGAGQALHANRAIDIIEPFLLVARLVRRNRPSDTVLTASVRARYGASLSFSPTVAA